MDPWQHSALIAAARSIVADRRAPLDSRLSALANELRLVADQAEVRSPAPRDQERGRMIITKVFESGRQFAQAYSDSVLRMAVQAKPRAIAGLHPPHRPRGTAPRPRFKALEKRLAQGELPLGR
jgi:hypothetical protein